MPASTPDARIPTLRAGPLHAGRAAMTVQAIRWESWALSEEADRRFRKIFIGVAIPALILAALITLIQLETKKTETSAYSGAQYVELQAPQGEVTPAPEEPKPAPKNEPKTEQAPKPVQKQQPVQKPVPAPVPTQTAREVAQKTQEMQAIQDQLSDLRNQNLSAVTTQTPLQTGIIASKGGVGGGSAEAIAASAAATSGTGVGGSGSVTSSQSGTGLGTRRTGSVQSPVGFGHGQSHLPGEREAGARSLSEIQEMFDRNKGALTAIYNREARDNPNMGDGQIFVSITIAPDGSVTSCNVVSSSFNDPDFEHKMVQRIMLFRFQAKSVPSFTLPRYRIDIHPM
jgi:TonB family protein